MIGSNPRIVVMGPSGSGKTAVGTALAVDLGLDFVDADDLHPAASLDKMSTGSPLDDEDRMPWLDIVARTLAEAPGLVVACSALARRYRDRMRSVAPDLVFVELLVDREELERRMLAREHFMPTSLLTSQLETLDSLEPDELGIAVRNTGSLVAVAVRSRIALESQSP